MNCGTIQLTFHLTFEAWTIVFSKKTQNPKNPKQNQQNAKQNKTQNKQTKTP